MEKEYDVLNDKKINEILEYINSYFYKNYNKDDQLENANNLSKFLKDKKYDIDENEADVLLEKSKDLNILFSCLLKLDGFSKVLKLKNLSILADMYCLRENIDFNIKEEGKSKDLNLYKVYMEDLSQYRKLSNEEEKALAIKASNGDMEARDLLIKHNLKFVVFLARRCQFDGISLLDLIQFGNEGLIVAINKFDPYRGVRFTTYAAYYIKQYMHRGFLNTNRVIKLPICMQMDSFKIKRETSKYLIESNGILPTEEELSKRLGISESRIKEIIENSKSVLSLSFSAYFGDDDVILFDSIEDLSPSLEEQANVEYLKEFVSKLKLHLKQRELHVIELLYGFYDDEMTLEAVGSIYGITRESVRQIRNRSLKRMRNICDVKFKNDKDVYKTYL